MTEPLSRYVPPSLTEARVSRLWTEIDLRSPPALAARRRLVELVVAACTAAVVAWVVVVVVGHGRGGRDAVEGSVIENGAVTLADGSRVAVSVGGSLHVETLRDDTVILALRSGSVDLVVPHTRRTLVVRTPRYDVVDLGTRFRVALDASGEACVRVSEGRVEIRSRKGDAATRRLEAGESWSSAPSAPPEVPVPPILDPSPGMPAGPAPSSAPRDAAAGPKELLESAERARLSGQPRAAGAALDTLRRRFRSDPRASLAAFDLGRLRLDSLSDAPGAVEAFDDAIALAPRGPLREDAEARRVEALGVERSPGCAAARDAFLARYPASAHAAVVAGRCAGE